MCLLSFFAFNILVVAKQIVHSVKIRSTSCLGSKATLAEVREQAVLVLSQFLHTSSIPLPYPYLTHSIIGENADIE